tara:strand:- start:1194 stop:1328 length:135 start_codon:yes stop_codon:yes gene_type:complete
MSIFDHSHLSPEVRKLLEEKLKKEFNKKESNKNKKPPKSSKKGG